MTALAPGRLLAQGREAEVFELGPGSVLRLMRHAGDEASGDADREAAVFEALAGSGVRVPKVLGRVSHEGRPGLILERLQGPDLLTEIGDRPWRLFAIGRLSGEVHARIAAMPAPAVLNPVRPGLEAAISSERANIPRLLREFALDTLAQLPDGDRLCHADYHPGNLLRTGSGEPAVIDWAHARAGDPLADFARSRVLLSIGALSPGTSAFLRLLARVGRSLLRSRYERAYRRHAKVDGGRLRQWEIVMLAARLAEAIPEERPAILRRLERYRAAARRAEIASPVLPTIAHSDRGPGASPGAG